LLEFDLDSDDLDHESLQQLENSHHSSMTQSANGDDQRMPLLVGLFDSSASRRSLDNPSLPLHGIDSEGNLVVIGDRTFDLDELATKHISGGGLMNSIANMANSILGAGKLPK
jgi:sodium-coupled neutral amino acid transporter 11